MTQTIIVAVIVIAALVYAGYRIYLNIRSAGDPCYGCPGCELHKQLMEKRRGCTKKTIEANKKATK